MTTDEQLEKIKELYNLVSCDLFEVSAANDLVMGLRRIKSRVLDTEYLRTTDIPPILRDQLAAISELICFYERDLIISKDPLFNNILVFLLVLESNMYDSMRHPDVRLMFNGRDYYWGDELTPHRLIRKTRGRRIK